MSIRYTLTLATDGAEVWKRWTGDREEAKSIALSGLVQVEASEQIARMFLVALDVDASGRMMPDSFSTADAFSADLRTRLTLDVRKSQGTVTQTTEAG